MKILNSGLTNIYAAAKTAFPSGDKEKGEELIGEARKKVLKVIYRQTHDGKKSFRVNSRIPTLTDDTLRTHFPNGSIDQLIHFGETKKYALTPMSSTKIP